MIVSVLGVIAMAVGAVAVAFGIAIKEFSFGNTLLIVGTTGLVGGMVLIGIAGAIRELGRIAAALAVRPAVPMPRTGADPYAAPRPGMAPLRPIAPMPPVPPQRSAAMAAEGGRIEPRLASGEGRGAATAAAATAGVASAAMPAMSAGVRPDAETPHRAGEPIEPPVVAEPDAIPLSPDAPRAEQRRTEIELQEAVRKAVSESLDRDGRGEQPDTAAQLRETADAPRPGEGEQRSLPFDAIWPKEDRPRRLARGTAAVDESPSPPELAGDSTGPAPEAPAAPAETADAGSEGSDVAAQGDAPQARSVPPAETAQATAAQDAERGAAAAAEAPRAISILKSGVVDGMAYTLYSDGSIEAVLDGETLRFASIAELRQHIEANA
jgi:hypothetical protein